MMILKLAFLLSVTGAVSCFSTPSHYRLGCNKAVVSHENERTSSLFSTASADTKTSTDTIEPQVKASRRDRLLNSIQIWALRRPRNIVSRMILFPISVVEGVMANQPPYLDRKRQIFGPNFCCAGQVVLGEFSSLDSALTQPQGRTNRLGTSVLDRKHMPADDRTVFPLALSNNGAGGEGEYEQVRQWIEDYITNDAAKKRKNDAVAEKLLDELAKDYTEMEHGKGGAFFADPKRGLLRFMVRYMHYVLLGMDPDAKDAIDVLSKFYFEDNAILHYFYSFKLIRRNKLFGQVTSIYKESPALVGSRENDPKYNNMTKDEMASLMVALLAIAAQAGPLALSNTAMGGAPLPSYVGRKTSEIDPTHVWDKIDLDDRDEVERYLFECGRLWMPVSASHRVAQGRFTTTIQDKEYSFPKGTIVNIPMILGMLDEKTWGPSTYEFDHERKNLCPFSMMFNSVGDRTNGRICPGRDIALTVLTDMMIKIGKVRRASAGEK